MVRHRRGGPKGGGTEPCLRMRDLRASVPPVSAPFDSSTNSGTERNGLHPEPAVLCARLQLCQRIRPPRLVLCGAVERVVLCPPVG